MVYMIFHLPFHASGSDFCLLRYLQYSKVGTFFFLFSSITYFKVSRLR